MKNTDPTDSNPLESPSFGYKIVRHITLLIILAGFIVYCIGYLVSSLFGESI